MANAWKIGVGSGALVLGIYLLFENSDIWSIVGGVFSIALGFGLFASELK